jgi:hypothetical protein
MGHVCQGPGEAVTRVFPRRLNVLPPTDTSPPQGAPPPLLQGCPCLGRPSKGLALPTNGADRLLSLNLAKRNFPAKEDHSSAQIGRESALQADRNVQNGALDNRQVRTNHIIRFPIGSYT